MDDQRDYAEEAANRAAMIAEGDAELAEEMRTDTSTKKDLRPARGNLEVAVCLMAVRYANSYADWTAALYSTEPGIARQYGALRRRHARQFQALQRLTHALAQS